MAIIFDRSPSPKAFNPAYLTYADAAGFTPSGDFTVECVNVNFTSTAGAQTFYAHYNATGNQRSILLDYVSGTGLRVILSTNGTATTTVSAAWTPSTATDYQIAVDRSGTDVRLYLDGAVHASGTVSGALHNSTAAPGIGHLNTTNVLAGTMDGFRLTVGTARYAGAHTPPTLPFPTS